MKPSIKKTAVVASLHLGSSDSTDLSKQSVETVTAALDGFVGDKHRGFRRIAYAGDKEPEGTERRNERQWSAMSSEEIGTIQNNMDLGQELKCSDLGANLCFEGIAGFSQLPKGTKFIFPSGAKLVVVEYNPPCVDMGEVLTGKYSTRSGAPLTSKSFPLAAIGLRGLVGVVDVVGQINVGDEVIVEIWDEANQVNIPRS